VTVLFETGTFSGRTHAGITVSNISEGIDVSCCSLQCAVGFNMIDSESKLVTETNFFKLQVKYVTIASEIE
jgi:hypothetical protein